MTDAPRNPNEIVFVNPEDGSRLTRGEISDDIKDLIEHIIVHLNKIAEGWAQTSDPDEIGPNVVAATMHLTDQLLPGLAELARHDSEQSRIAAGIREYAESVQVDVPDFIPQDWE